MKHWLQVVVLLLTGSVAVSAATVTGNLVDITDTVPASTRLIFEPLGVVFDDDDNLVLRVPMGVMTDDNGDFSVVLKLGAYRVRVISDYYFTIDVPNDAGTYTLRELVTSDTVYAPGPLASTAWVLGLSLTNHTDVLVTGDPADGEVLSFDDASGKWINSAGGGGGGSGTVTSVDITGPAAGLTFTGGPITASGVITAALANDLAGVEGLGTTGITARTADGVWAARTITGDSEIAVADGDGVAGNPTLSIGTIPATKISVADSGGNYTAPDVEGVLAEIAPQLGGGGGGDWDWSFTEAPMAALAIDTAEMANTKSVAGDVTFTFNPDPPAAGQMFGMILTETGGVNRTITIPESYTHKLNDTITTFTLFANQTIWPWWYYDGTGYRIYFDNLTIDNLPELLSIDLAADPIMVWDSSAGGTKKYYLNNVGVWDAIQVGGVDVSDININSTVPAAPAGGKNIKMQTSGSAPTQMTGYLDLTENFDFGGAASFEIPNGIVGTTDAAGEIYFDTNGDAGGANLLGPMIQTYNGTALGYLFPIPLPLAASQDNYVMKYDATAKTIQWEADETGGGGANSFETQDAPAGTDPVASSATDTLTWTVTGPLTLTGDSATDTMAFAWSGTFADAQVSATSVTQHEAALEAVLDLQDMQGAVTDAQVPDTITITPPQTDLAAGTSLAINTHYFDSFSGNRNLTFSGTPSDGDIISLSFDTNTEITLGIPTSYRIGGNSTTTSIVFPTGNHRITWLRADGRWYVADSGSLGSPGQLGIVIDGGGSVITTGTKGYFRVPYDCTINSVDVVADQSGSIVVDVWVDTYANFPPVDADSITASAPPTLSTAQKSQDATLTGWTTSLSEGSYIAYSVDSATTVQLVTVTLEVTR